ncbi:DNA replication factor CDT1 like protein [Ancylostoma caninum]|uniref:DNA replication factor CDT1 like protein n=1 Tax=Ancylostoma caninum TaxID=29170 RepID=A0A368GPG5_ANCCA|nr:DNA replication factor CDT1 like protein [Ancylostoma caninum]
MSCRSTRSRAAKIVLSEPVEQTRKITDVFKVTRGRGRPQKKLLSSGEPVPNQKVLQNLTEQPSAASTCSSNASESVSVCSPPKRAKKSSDVNVVRSARKVLFSSEVDIKELRTPEHELVVEKLKEEVQKPPATESEDALVEINAEPPALPAFLKKEESATVVPPLNPALAKADELLKKLSSSSAQNKVKTRIRSVAELQAALAEKGGLKKIHEQAQRNKCKQVEEHVNLLKSPTKVVPTGSAVARAKTKHVKECKTEQRVPPTPSYVPEFVLPTHATPAKNVDEFELNEKRHVFEYGRASRLVEEVKNNAVLPLPLQYERLLETFQSCDRVVSIYTTQGRRCVVSEIQRNVEKNTQISFTRKNLAQIVHVYPTCYDIRLEKRWNPFGGESKSCGKFDLVMAANLTDDLSGYMLPDTPVKKEELPLPTVTPNKLLSPRKKVVTVMPRDPVMDARPRLEGWRMTCRSHVFRHKLVEIAKTFHRKFMERIGLFMNESEYLKLRRFHPKFDLDAECEGIPEAVIPEVPHDDAERRLEMRDYLATVDTSVALPKAVDAAIEEMKSPVKKIVSAEAAVPLSPRQFAEKQASKPKGAMSLLERIRAKEAAKKAAESMRDPVVERKIELLQRILHGLLRCITTYFAFKKVRSMEMNMLSEQVMRSQSSMSRSLLLEHVTLLCEVASDHVSLTEVAGKKYLQIKDNNYSTLETLVKVELARLRENPSSLRVDAPAAALKKPAVRALF